VARFLRTEINLDGYNGIRMLMQCESAALARSALSSSAGSV